MPYSINELGRLHNMVTMTSRKVENIGWNENHFQPKLFTSENKYFFFLPSHIFVLPRKWKVFFIPKLPFPYFPKCLELLSLYTYGGYDPCDLFLARVLTMTICQSTLVSEFFLIICDPICVYALGLRFCIKSH